MSVPKMNKWIEDNPATPLFWGAQKKGMQPVEECKNQIPISTKLFKEYNIDREELWEMAQENACLTAKKYWDAGYHQQIPNRLTHAFQMAEYIVTATDWDNFFALRLHDDAAQSEIKELARCMKEALETAVMCAPRSGWHLPYVSNEDLEMHGLRKCKILSAARCCVISYNNHETDQPMSLEKAEKLFNHLVTDTNPHYTPLEHQARVLTVTEAIECLRASSAFAHGPASKARQCWYYANFAHWVSQRYELEHNEETNLCT